MNLHNEDKQLDYSTKIDGYFFDKKEKTTKIILKIRNKRAVSSISIKDIIFNKDFLSKLSSIDLCVIGILSNKRLDKKIKDKNYLSISDEHINYKINNFLKIIGRDFYGNEEVIKIKMTGVEKILSIPASVLFNNKKILAALQYQDALSVGFSLSETHFEESILRKENFDVKFCLHIALFFGLFFISILLSGTTISLRFLDLKIKSEFSNLPFLIHFFLVIIGKFKYKESNKIVFSSVLMIVVFIVYYFFITQLPFVASDVQTIKFNKLYIDILSKNTIIFIMSIIFSSLFFFYNEAIRTKIGKTNFNRSIFHFVYLATFCITYTSLSFIFCQNSFFWLEFIYCSTLIVVLMKLKNIISNIFATKSY